MTENLIPAPPEEVKDNKRLNFLVGLVAIVGLTLGFIIFAVSSGGSSKLEAVAQECKAGNADESGIVVSGYVQEFSPTGGAGFEKVVCILDETEAPTVARNKLATASGMSGPIEASWDGYQATFTYNGIDESFTFTIEEV